MLQRHTANSDKRDAGFWDIKLPPAEPLQHGMENTGQGHVYVHSDGPNFAS